MVKRNMPHFRQWFSRLSTSRLTTSWCIIYRCLIPLWQGPQGCCWEEAHWSRLQSMHSPSTSRFCEGTFRGAGVLLCLLACILRCSLKSLYYLFGMCSSWIEMNFVGFCRYVQRQWWMFKAKHMDKVLLFKVSRSFEDSRGYRILM